MAFDSASAFLKHIKAIEYRHHVGRLPSAEYVRLHIEEAKQAGALDIEPETFLDDLYTSLLNKLVGLLPPNQGQMARESLAIGIVSNTDVNAFITRSKDRKHFAIGINSALNSMLTHFAKLATAANNPEAVIYCNGMDVRQLTRRDYITLSAMMLKKYGDTGVPEVPHLKFALSSPALKNLDFMLSAMLLFIVGHELGHFANGDLASDLHYSKADFLGGASIFDSSISHEQEFKADRTAFRLILRAVAAEQPDALARPLLDYSVTNVFNFLREISNRGSESHPRPSDRLLNVTREFFGVAAANTMEASFGDLREIELFQDLVGKKTVSQILNPKS